MIKKCSHRLLTFFFHIFCRRKNLESIVPSSFWFQYFIIVSLILLCVLIFEIMRINFEQFHSIHFKRNFKFSLKDTFLYFEICLINLIGLKEIWRPCWNTIFHIKLNQNIFCSIMPSTLLNYFTMILKISWFITMVDCVSHNSLLERTTQCCLKPPQHVPNILRIHPACSDQCFHTRINTDSWT